MKSLTKKILITTGSFVAASAVVVPIAVVFSNNNSQFNQLNLLSSLNSSNVFISSNTVIPKNGESKTLPEGIEINFPEGITENIVEKYVFDSKDENSTETNITIQLISGAKKTLLVNGFINFKKAFDKLKVDISPFGIFPISNSDIQKGLPSNNTFILKSDLINFNIEQNIDSYSYEIVSTKINLKLFSVFNDINLERNIEFDSKDFFTQIEVKQNMISNINPKLSPFFYKEILNETISGSGIPSPDLVEFIFSSNINKNNISSFNLKKLEENVILTLNIFDSNNTEISQEYNISNISSLPTKQEALNLLNSLTIISNTTSFIPKETDSQDGIPSTDFFSIAFTDNIKIDILKSYSIVKLNPTTVSLKLRTFNNLQIEKSISGFIPQQNDLESIQVISSSIVPIFDNVPISTDIKFLLSLFHFTFPNGIDEDNLESFKLNRINQTEVNLILNGKKDTIVTKNIKNFPSIEEAKTNLEKIKVKISSIGIRPTQNETDILGFPSKNIFIFDFPESVSKNNIINYSYTLNNSNSIFTLKINFRNNLTKSFEFKYSDFVSSSNAQKIFNEIRIEVNNNLINLPQEEVNIKGGIPPYIEIIDNGTQITKDFIDFYSVKRIDLNSFQVILKNNQSSILKYSAILSLPKSEITQNSQKEVDSLIIDASIRKDSALSQRLSLENKGIIILAISDIDFIFRNIEGGEPILNKYKVGSIIVEKTDVENGLIFATLIFTSINNNVIKKGVQIEGFLNLSDLSKNLKINKKILSPLPDIGENNIDFTVSDFSIQNLPLPLENEDVKSYTVQSVNPLLGTATVTLTINSPAYENEFKIPNVIISNFNNEFSKEANITGRIENNTNLLPPNTTNSNEEIFYDATSNNSQIIFTNLPSGISANDIISYRIINSSANFINGSVKATLKLSDAFFNITNSNVIIDGYLTIENLKNNIINALSENFNAFYIGNKLTNEFKVGENIPLSEVVFNTLPIGLNINSFMTFSVNSIDITNSILKIKFDFINTEPFSSLNNELKDQERIFTINL